MFKLFRQIIIGAAIIVLTGCVSIDGPYKGKVVDAETNQPIEGAVVHGSWHRIYLGGGSEYYDNYELLTDKNGEFKIPGQGLMVGSIVSRVDGMMLTIFKAGYEQVRPSFWWGMRKYPDSYKMVTWQDKKGIFKLRRLTLEERRKGGPVEPDGPANKQRLWRIERNKEMIEIGRPADALLPVE
jgi:hypothetical protein